jgi:hypothetical protein
MSPVTSARVATNGADALAAAIEKVEFPQNGGISGALAASAGLEAMTAYPSSARDQTPRALLQPTRNFRHSSHRDGSAIQFQQ